MHLLLRKLLWTFLCIYFGGYMSSFLERYIIRNEIVGLQGSYMFSFWMYCEVAFQVILATCTSTNMQVFYLFHILSSMYLFCVWEIFIFNAIKTLLLYLLDFTIFVQTLANTLLCFFEGKFLTSLATFMVLSLSLFLTIELMHV